MKKELFSVDVLGLRETQLGKPKYIVIRELLQNALDERTTICEVKLRYEHGKAKITVTDDSPEGFRDLSDAYTLFASTPKRNDVKKRGRFNFGEKQVICLCDYARIISTKGGVEFFVLDGERKDIRKKRDVGSEIYVEMKMTHDEYWECVNYCDEIIIPENMDVKVYYSEPNMEGSIGKIIDRPTPKKIFNTILPTEIKTEEGMKIRKQETDVHLHTPRGDKAYIHELGIPICEIDCKYSIDIQQKVPLSTDRDKVDAKYLKGLYAEVLNQIFDEVTEGQASSTWVRSAIETGNVAKEAVASIVEERFGDKVVIANPFDKRSIDEALSNGYRVVYGNEMSKEEWSTIHKNGAMVSSSDKFKWSYAAGENVTPSKQQLKVFSLVKRIGECMGFNPMISLVSCKGATVLATFVVGGSSLEFYDNKIPKDWWEADENGFIKQSMLDLIIHELCHRYGMHCDRAYLDAITKNGAMLVKKAIEQKSFFKVS